MSLRKLKDLNELIGHQTILYGESNTGKTHNAAIFLQFLLNSNIDPKTISVLDFAPKCQIYNKRKIGGKIIDYFIPPDTLGLFLDVETTPPRLTGKNKREIKNYALQNQDLTKKALKRYLIRPTPILIVNDISIYLQKGSIRFFIKVLKSAITFYGNSYYGKSISNKYSKRFSKIESNKILRLIENIELSYFTG